MAKPFNPYFAFGNVSKAFGSAVVLEDVTFEVKRGSVVCIMDGTGAGKAVCHLLMGFLRPDSGRVISAGEEITEYSADQLQSIHHRVTMIFQDGTVINESSTSEIDIAVRLEERGSLHQSEIGPSIEGLLEELGVSRSPSPKHAGIRWWTAIAKALAEKPEAVLFEGPTTRGDPLEVRRLGELLQHLKTESTLTGIVVTRDVQLAREVADRILLLHRGKMVISGTITEITEIARTLQPFDRIFQGDDQSIFPSLPKSVKARLTDVA